MEDGRWKCGSVGSVQVGEGAEECVCEGVETWDCSMVWKCEGVRKCGSVMVGNGDERRSVDGVGGAAAESGEWIFSKVSPRTGEFLRFHRMMALSV